MSGTYNGDERPTKRQRLSPEPIDETAGTKVSSTGNSTAADPVYPTIDAKEVEVGITAYVSEDLLPFQALLKKRYTDFLVNEILPGGEVVHLTDTTVPQAPLSGSSKRKNNRKNNDTVVSSNGDLSKSEVSSTSNEPNLNLPDTKESAGRQDATSIEGSNSGDISEKDKQQLIAFLNEKAVDGLLDLYKAILAHPTRKSKDHALVRTEFSSDRSIRAEIHGAIRRIFCSKIDSSTDKDGFLCLTAASPNARKPNVPQNGGDSPYHPGKLGWLERGGDYLHFTLYKENKDTMEAIGFLVRQMKISTKTFQFAGTKDRRAVTAQRISAYRLDAERLAKQNQYLRNAAVGDFAYKPTSLELGDLGGNEFVITLRECDFPGLTDSAINSDLTKIQSALDVALTNLRTKGFLNYYGLQRFGTFSTRTDTTGLHMLKSDFRAACEAVLDYDEAVLTTTDIEHQSGASTPTTAPHIGPGRDEIARATAIQLFKKTGNAHKSLEILPKKFSAENQLMRHLSRIPTDYIGALLTIPRNLRLMYVHAYQSLVWNKAVTHRWQLYGSTVVEGDLVLIKEHQDKESTTAESELATVDADGEIIIAPPIHDRANRADDIFDRARALTATEAASGQYTIFDLVLPLPGYDVIYPANKSGQFYTDYMGSEEGGGLDPNDMRRKQKDFSLSGGYRKLMARIGESFSVEVKKYARDEEQFVMTDLERIREKDKDSEVKAESKENKGGSDTAMVDAVKAGGEGESKIADVEVRDKIAAVLKFQLGASQYATMALRELSRGGVAAYKADIGAAK